MQRNNEPFNGKTCLFAWYFLLSNWQVWQKANFRPWGKCCIWVTHGHWNVTANSFKTPKSLSSCHFLLYLIHHIFLQCPSCTVTFHFRCQAISALSTLFCLCVNWRRQDQRLEEISFITSTPLPCSFIFSISFARWPWEKLIVRGKYFLLICHCSVSSCCKSLFKHNYCIPFKRHM